MFDLNDSNVWGFLAVPVGVAIGFGPAILVWLKLEYGSQSGKRDDKP